MKRTHHLLLIFIPFIFYGCCTSTPQEITVSVEGQVKAPGTYQFQDGATVADAVKKAGGFTEWVQFAYSYLQRGEEKISLQNFRKSEGKTRLKDRDTLYFQQEVF